MVRVDLYNTLQMKTDRIEDNPEAILSCESLWREQVKMLRKAKARRMCMKRKVLAGIMAAVLSLSLFTGCGKDDGETGSNQESSGAQENSREESSDGQSQGEEESGEQSSGEWTGEVSKVIMVFPTGGVEPADLGKVLEAINEISIKEAGVEVEFKPVSIFDLSSAATRWIGGGEQIDLLPVAFTPMEPFITQNMIQPLDQWKDLAPDVWAKAEEAPIFDINFTGNVYGLAPTAPNGMQGTGGGYLIAKDDLEAAKLDYEDGQIITLDDLDTIFAAIKEAKPDVLPCGVIGSMDRANFTFISDPLGASANSGVVMGLDSTTVVNMYASEEYKTYLEHVRSWYEKGYTLKDAATTGTSLDDLVASGGMSGYFSDCTMGLKIQLEQRTGREFVRLMFQEPFIVAQAGSMGSFMTIPVTSKNPEGAMRFLNLMYKDSRIVNLLLWGIEDVHYVMVDREENIIALPEGVDTTNNPYAYGLGLFGNQDNAYSMGSSTKEADEAWTEIALGRRTKGYGFCYDASKMTDKITAIDAVIQEYVPALTTGSADMESTYANFIEKLEANGINELVADKQAQFDAWLAQQ